jgi:hypothetical protein
MRLAYLLQIRICEKYCLVIIPINQAVVSLLVVNSLPVVSDIQQVIPVQAK